MVDQIMLPLLYEQEICKTDRGGYALISELQHARYIS